MRQVQFIELKKERGGKTTDRNIEYLFPKIHKLQSQPIEDLIQQQVIFITTHFAGNISNRVFLHFVLSKQNTV